MSKGGARATYPPELRLWVASFATYEEAVAYLARWRNATLERWEVVGSPRWSVWVARGETPAETRP